MSTEPMLGASLWSSLALVAMLGFRHGFDADHIAAVDGMTRARQLQHSYWAGRRVGLQFALGHSAVILAASLLLFGQSARLPAWLDGLGLVISIGFLLMIAALNLGHACGSTGRPGAGAAGGMTTALLRWTGGNLHPALVGMAFALSFDALAQAAFFASRGQQFSGMGAVALLAAAFGAGMVLADAGNGAWLNWCAGQGDRMARQASRLSSALIALLALFTAAAALLRETNARFARQWDHAGVWIGVGLMVISCAVLLGAVAWQRWRRGAELNVPMVR